MTPAQIKQTNREMACSGVFLKRASRIRQNGGEMAERLANATALMHDLAVQHSKD